MSELVKRAVLYDDKIQIYYNYTDSKRENKGTDGDSVGPFVFTTKKRFSISDYAQVKCLSVCLNPLKQFAFPHLTDIICTLGLCFMIFYPCFS